VFAVGFYGGILPSRWAGEMSWAMEVRGMVCLMNAAG